MDASTHCPLTLGPSGCVRKGPVEGRQSSSPPRAVAVLAVKAPSWHWPTAGKILSYVAFLSLVVPVGPTYLGLSQLIIIQEKETHEPGRCCTRPAAGSLSSGKPDLGGTKTTVLLFREEAGILPLSKQVGSRLEPGPAARNTNTTWRSTAHPGWD